MTETTTTTTTTAIDPAKAVIDPDKFTKRRRHQRLHGICNLMVEYGVTLSELEKFFLEEYETKDAEMFRKRNGHKQRPIKKARAANALKSRWDKYEAMKTSHLVAKEEAKQRVAEVPKPDFDSFGVEV